MTEVILEPSSFVGKKKQQIRDFTPTNLVRSYHCRTSATSSKSGDIEWSEPNRELNYTSLSLIGTKPIISRTTFHLTEQNLWKLEIIFGKTEVRLALDQHNNVVNNSVINELLANDKRKIYKTTDGKKTHYVANRNFKCRRPFSPLRKTRFSEFMRKFGIDLAEELIEHNIVTLDE